MEDLTDLKRQIVNLKKEKEYKSEKLKLEKELADLRKASKPESNWVKGVKQAYSEVDKVVGKLKQNQTNKRGLGLFG